MQTETKILAPQVRPQCWPWRHRYSPWEARVGVPSDEWGINRFVRHCQRCGKIDTFKRFR